MATDGDSGNVIRATFGQGPHGTGLARCLGCRHEWRAVVEVGTTQLECPSCGAWKGIFLGEYVPEEFWLCGCGCDLFYITTDGSCCPNCGIRTEWER